MTYGPTNRRNCSWDGVAVNHDCDCGAEINDCNTAPMSCMSTSSDLLTNLQTDPAGGAYSAPPDPLAVLRGPTSKGRGGGGREGKGVRGAGKGGRGGTPLLLGYTPCN